MPFNANSTIKQIKADEQARAVLEKYLPEIWKDPRTNQALNMSLKVMASFPQAGISKEKLQQIVDDLAQIP